MRYLNANKPKGLSAEKVEFVHNPNLKRAFESNLSIMNMQARNPFFAPTWERDLKQTEQRKQVIRDWESSVAPFSPVITSEGEEITEAKILPLINGCSQKALPSICSTGPTYFGKHSFFNPEMGLTSFSTDQGYFGSGIYFTDSPDYASRYSQDKVLVIYWVSGRPPLPVVSDVRHPKKCSDMTLLEGHGHFSNHNLHVIPVAQVKGLVYYPCFEGQKPECKEYVVFDPSQALPWMIITLAPDGPSKAYGHPLHRRGVCSCLSAW